MEQIRTRTEINRENAQKSTGPRSVEGKSRAAANSFKHGLYSQATIINGESVEDFDDLRHDFLAHYSPEDPVECSLVEELVQNRWRILRFRRHEATIFSNAGTSYPDLKLLATVQRLLTSAERAFGKALTQLEAIRKQKPAELGFVPQNSTAKVDPSGFVPQNDAANGRSHLEVNFESDYEPWLRSEILLKRLP